MNNKTLKTAIYFVLIIVITLLFSYSLLSNRLFVGLSQDTTYHISRIIGLSNAFEEGQILPKIYPYANNGYGYASPLFYCDIFLYPFAVLYHFGVGAVLCYKLAIIFYTLLGNIIIYIVINKIFKNDLYSLIAVILYSGSNYHLQNVLFRSAFGEILAMAFIPLVLYSIYQLLVNKKNNWISLGVSFSLLIMSHLISSFIVGIFFLIMIIISLIYYRKDRNTILLIIKTTLKATALGLLLTAWYLFPMIEQFTDQKFWISINAQYNNIGSTKQTILNFICPFALTSLNGYDITKSANVGSLLIIISIIYLFIKKNKVVNIIYIFSLLLIIVILGLINIDLIRVIQFNFRFYCLLVPLLTIISVYTISKIDKRNILIVVIIVITIINTYLINRVIQKDGEYYLNNSASYEEIINITRSEFKTDYNHDELGGAEYLPYTTGYMDFNNESSAIKYLNGKDKIDYIWDYDRNFTTIEFNCNNQEDKTLIIPLTYYKGYKAYELVGADYKEIDLNVYEESKELSINSPQGEHTYKIVYKGTTTQKMSLVLSVITAFLLIAMVLKICIKKRRI